MSQVNNAGICFHEHTQDLFETDMEVFDKTNAVNFRGVFLGMKHASRCHALTLVSFHACYRRILLSFDTCVAHGSVERRRVELPAQSCVAAARLSDLAAPPALLLRLDHVALQRAC